MEPGQDDARQAVYPGFQIALSFILGWAFVIGGFLGLLYLPLAIWRTHQFVTHAVHAQMPIVDFKSYPPGRGQSHDSYRPIVEITDIGGESARVPMGVAALPNPYRVGDRIEVLYPPGKPADAVTDTTEDIWGAVIAAAIIFASMLLMGVGVVLWMRFFVRHPPDHILWLDRWAVPLKIVVRLVTG